MRISAATHGCVDLAPEGFQRREVRDRQDRRYDVGSIAQILDWTFSIAVPSARISRATPLVHLTVATALMWMALSKTSSSVRSLSRHKACHTSTHCQNCD
jgi:hypothetical protein